MNKQPFYYDCQVLFTAAGKQMTEAQENRLKDAIVDVLDEFGFIDIDVFVSDGEAGDPADLM